MVNQRFPTQDSCDPEDPEEHFLWALHQVPLGDKASMPIQPNLARAIGKHLHECGFRHRPELQTRKLQPPHRGQQVSTNAMARWVSMDEEDPEPVILPDVSAMTVHEQELMVRELEKAGRLKPPDRDLGKVGRTASFSEIREAAERGESL